MAIKIYQSQIRPTEEVTERATTSGMKISQQTATMVPRAMKGMLQAGEDFYIKYEQIKSENEVQEKLKDLNKTEIEAGTGNVTKLGYGNEVNKLKESTKPDEAMASYKQLWQNKYDQILPTLKGKFSKKYFKNAMDKKFISDSGTIRDNTFVNFRNETRAVRVNKLNDIVYRLANNPEKSAAHNQALVDKGNFFTSQNNYELFGDKFKQLQFDTNNNIDALTIEVDLDKDPRQTYRNFKAGKYKNLNAINKTKIGLRITLAAQQQTTIDLAEEGERSKLGLAAKFSADEYLAPFKGYKNYEKIKNIVDTNDYVRNAITQVHTAKSGEGLSKIKLYDLTGDNIGSKKKANNIISIEIAKRQKSIKDGDAAGYFSKVDTDLRELDNRYQQAKTSEDKKKIIQEKKILLDQKYNDLNIPSSKRFYMSKAEANGYVQQVKNAPRWQDKEAVMQGLQDLYGKDNFPKVVEHLRLEKLPIENQISLSTNSASLKKDILAADSIKDLDKNVKSEINSAAYKSIDTKISQALNKYEDIVTALPDGSVNKTEHLVGLKNSLRKAILLRIQRDNDVSGSITSVTKEFLSDYDTSPRSYWIPKDVNGEPTTSEVIKTKAEAIQLAVETSDYIERFHGKDGFAHYATTPSSMGVLPDNVKISTDKVFQSYVKDTITKSIKKNSKWILNNKGTGIVLNFDGTKGFIPIQNAKGEKIEFLFVDDPSQIGSQTIESTEYNEPGTGRPLTIISPYDFGDSEVDLDQ